jgi:solute carrier family 40 (iron-regulated transporter), member 1
MPHGFHAVALSGFISHISVLALAPTVGRLMDRANRRHSLERILLLQNLVLVTTAAYLLVGYQANPEMLANPVSMTIIILLQALQRLFNVLSDVAVERDWAVVLTDRETLALAACNANIRRVDQICEVAACLLFGAALTHMGLAWTLVTSVLVGVVACPSQLFAIHKMCLSAGVMIEKQRITPEQKQEQGPRAATTRDGVATSTLPTFRSFLSGNRVVVALRDTLASWTTFFQQPTVLPCMSFIVLFFNAGLSPSGLLTAFLIYSGMSGTAVAMFRSCCAGAGFVGIWLGTRYIHQRGLVASGIISLRILLWFSVLATAIFFLSVAPGAPYPLTDLWLGNRVDLLLICILVAMSRLGLWMFDMSEAQIFQTMVDPRESGTVSSVEISFCSLAELAMMGIAVYSDPAQYGVVILLSLAAVVLSTLIYEVWIGTGATSKMAEATRHVDILRASIDSDSGLSPERS